MDLTFYFLMVTMTIEHMKPEVIQKAKPVLLRLRDVINGLFPGE